MDPIMIPILGIVFGCSVAIFGVWTKHREKIAQMQLDTTAEHTAEKAAQYAAQMQQLSDRVQVLERIVTDRGYDVATQIEALRDTRTVESSDTGIPLNISKKEQA